MRATLLVITLLLALSLLCTAVTLDELNGQSRWDAEERDVYARHQRTLRGVLIGDEEQDGGGMSVMHHHDADDHDDDDHDEEQESDKMPALPPTRSGAEGMIRGSPYAPPPTVPPPTHATHELPSFPPRMKRPAKRKKSSVTAASTASAVPVRGSTVGKKKRSSCDARSVNTPWAGPRFAYVVRHAEKLPTKGEHLLNKIGLERAERLREHFAQLPHGPLTAIYVPKPHPFLSNFRPAQTATPLAAYLRLPLLTPAYRSEAAKLRRAVFSNMSVKGGAVLVVWEHTCIQDAVVSLLGKQAAEHPVPNWPYYTFNRVFLIEYDRCGRVVAFSISCQRFGLARCERPHELSYTKQRCRPLSDLGHTGRAAAAAAVSAASMNAEEQEEQQEQWAFAGAVNGDFVDDDESNEYDRAVEDEDDDDDDDDDDDEQAEAEIENDRHLSPSGDWEEAEWWQQW